MAAKESNFLCKTIDIDDLSSKGFSVKIKRKMTEIFVVRKGEHFYAYLDICPHTQAPLEWNKDQFLDSNKKTIICALHGARFSIAEGDCLEGPCNGTGLTTVDLEIIDDKIFLI